MVRRDAWTALAAGWVVSIAAAAGTATAAERAALFPFEIIVEDTLEGIPMASPVEKRRLVLMTTESLRLLAASERYEVVDTAHVAAEIEKEAPFFRCNACEVEIARKTGARLVITGLVQKGSATTANISIAVRDVTTGELVRTGGITVLENTDEGWVRGVRRLVQSRLIEWESRK